MSRVRIVGSDTVSDIMVKMSEGNPGALTCLMQVLKDDTTDPDNLGGGLSVILQLDSMGIYGTDIYVLWSDICKRNIVHFLAVLRACRLGLFPASTVTYACHRQDYSGVDMVPVYQLYMQVKYELSAFDAGIEPPLKQGDV